MYLCAYYYETNRLLGAQIAALASAASHRSCCCATLQLSTLSNPPRTCSSKRKPTSPPRLAQPFHSSTLSVTFTSVVFNTLPQNHHGVLANVSNITTNQKPILEMPMPVTDTTAYGSNGRASTSQTVRGVLPQVMATQHCSHTR